MASSPSCPLLCLPQELRDSIYDHAISGSIANECLHRSKDIASSCGHDVPWTLQFPEHAPTATYLSIMLCCRQLRDEMTAFLAADYRPEHRSAILQLDLKYPVAAVPWMYIPRPPKQLTELNIAIGLAEMFNPAYDRTHHSILLRPVFEVLSRFVHRGPYLARNLPLQQRGFLSSVRITVGSAIPLEDLTYVFGNPTLQLESLFVRFKLLLERLASSGLLSGSVGAFEVRLEGQEWSRMPVTSDFWDEQDVVLFDNLGFEWGFVEDR